MVATSQSPSPRSSGSMSVDVLQIWQRQLEPAVALMLRTQESLGRATHAAVYTTIYNVIMTDREHGGHRLYTLLCVFYAAYTAKIFEAAPKDNALVLAYYDSQWIRFTRGATVVDRLFNYLNRDYVSLQRDEGRKDVKTVLHVALTQWKLNMLDPIAWRLEAALNLNTEEPSPIAQIAAKLASDDAMTAADFSTMCVRTIQFAPNPSEGDHGPN
ncbi:Cullin-domain-containing protein [Mycena venus]|uniref:Cullin-domain-containing protein n=1 Tax=Mycena venus TaxID=2733690 RepID=A0A8H6YPX0_9AGAR|nr:Cullin-domain-containing protein [Mycena venus]